MSDLALVWHGERRTADLAQHGVSMATDDSLRTAVIASLFTDRRARADDSVPGDPADRRGWWGDAFPAADAVPARIGSRLWLLSREKQLPSVVARARDYAQEALSWLIERGIATRVNVQAEIAAPGTLALLIEIERPRSAAIEYRFAYAWGAA